MIHTTVKSVLAAKKNPSFVWSIDPKDSVYKAVELMSEHEIGALLVLEDTRIRGIVTERDYARKCILKNRSSKSTPVNTIMDKRVYCVSPEHTAEQAMSIMTYRHVRHLPVLKNGNLEGLVSIGDIVKAMLNDKTWMINQLENFITGSPNIDALVVTPNGNSHLDSATLRIPKVS